MTWMSSDTTLFLRGQTLDLSSKYAFLILYSIVELGLFREWFLLASAGKAS